MRRSLLRWGVQVVGLVAIVSCNFSDTTPKKRQVAPPAFADTLLVSDFNSPNEVFYCAVEAGGGAGGARATGGAGGAPGAGAGGLMTTAGAGGMQVSDGGSGGKPTSGGESNEAKKAELRAGACEPPWLLRAETPSQEKVLRLPEQAQAIVGTTARWAPGVDSDLEDATAHVEILDAETADRDRFLRYELSKGSDSLQLLFGNDEPSDQLRRGEELEEALERCADPGAAQTEEEQRQCAALELDLLRLPEGKAEDPYHDLSAYDGLFFWARLGPGMPESFILEHVAIITQQTDNAGGVCQAEPEDREDSLDIVEQNCSAHFRTLPGLQLTSQWQWFYVPFDGLLQPGWSRQDNAGPFDPTVVKQVSFQIELPGTIDIDDVQFVKLR